MIPRWPLVVLVVPTLACASTGGSGERGLAPLRESLSLLPPSGHVERDARGAWLVDDELHVRLAAIPTSAGACAPKPDSGPVWRLFEGKPGAALAFAGGDVTVWWYDEAMKCARSAPVLGLDLPTDVSDVGSASWAHAPGDVGDGDASDDAAGDVTTVELDLDGHPGAKAQLSAKGLEVVDAAGDSLFDASDASYIDATCGSHYQASLARAKAADGTTFLHLTRTSTQREPLSSDDKTCSDDTAGETSESEDVWVAFRPHGGPIETIASTHASRGAYGEETITSTSLVPLGAGALRFERDEESSGWDSRNGGSSVSWTWSFVPPSGEAVELVSGTGF
ncbi:MAG: hypothetical protein U1F43_20235 [Myxococcota bacterium]